MWRVKGSVVPAVIGALGAVTSKTEEMAPADPSNDI